MTPSKKKGGDGGVAAAVAASPPAPPSELEALKGLLMRADGGGGGLLKAGTSSSKTTSSRGPPPGIAAASTNAAKASKQEVAGFMGLLAGAGLGAGSGGPAGSSSSSNSVTIVKKAAGGGKGARTTGGTASETAHLASMLGGLGGGGGGGSAVPKPSPGSSNKSRPPGIGGGLKGGGGIGKKGKGGKDNTNSGGSGAKQAAKPRPTFTTDPTIAKEGHKLDGAWVLWHDAPAANTQYRHRPQGKWEDSLNLVFRFEYVEEFWGLVSQIQTASEVEVRGNYHLFREGIKPMWEDPGNKAGGKWVHGVPKKHRNNLNDFWADVMMLCIGNEGHASTVCGAVISPRPKMDRIAIWTSHATNKDAVMAVGHAFKGLVDRHSPGGNGNYQGHSESSKIKYTWADLKEATADSSGSPGSTGGSPAASKGD